MLQNRVLVFLVVAAAAGPVWAQRQAANALPAGQYGPVFAESGFREDGHYFDLGFDASVNHYGGNLIVSATDISLPSQGLFSLTFRRTYNSHHNLTWTATVLTEHDSPLGFGWTGHYGVLLPAGWGGTSPRPQLIDSTGTRHLFYRHNLLGQLVPFGQRGSGWISTSLAVLTQELASNEPYYLLREPNGLVTTFSRPRLDPANPTSPYLYPFFVPTEIRDIHGNQWAITYEGFNNQFESTHLEVPLGGYYVHPLVKTVTEVGPPDRTLEFEYTIEPVTYKKRLQLIRFNGAILSQYGYRLSSNQTLLYLRSHTTGAGRSTEYITQDQGTPGLSQAEAVPPQVVSRLHSITGRTRGEITFGYSLVFIDYSQWGGTPQPVYALTSLDRDGRTWSYVYTRNAQDRHQVDVTCALAGNTEFRGTYSYFTYGQNAATNILQAWKIGLILDSTETFNGTTTTRSCRYDAFQVSQDPIGNQLTAQVSASRPTSESRTQDGTTLTTTYLDYDTYNFPRRVEGPGAGEKRWFSYHHVADSALGYLLGTNESERLTFGADTNTISSTTYSFNAGQVLPHQQSIQRTVGARVDVSMEFWQQGTGKLGALKRKSAGSYSEDYDYEYGTLKSITYAVGPNMSRTIHPDGTVHTETAQGVTRTFEWDLDSRPTKVITPATDDVMVVYQQSYPNNLVTVTQGTSEKVLTYDLWGRRVRRQEKTDSNQYAVESVGAFDAFDRPVSETTQPGAAYTTVFDVHGRQVSRRLTNGSTTERDDHVFGYQTDSDGSVTTTDTRNPTWSNSGTAVPGTGIVRVKKVDPLGRILRGSTNGRFVDYTYSYEGGDFPLRQEIRPQDQANSVRTVWFDLLGNKVKEQHPETGTITYGFSPEGWLQSTDRAGQDHFYVHDARGRVTETHAGLSASGMLLSRTGYHATYGSVVSSENVLDDVLNTYADHDAAGRPRKVASKIPAAFAAPVMLAPAGQWQTLGPLSTRFEWEPVRLPGTQLADQYQVELFDLLTYPPYLQFYSLKVTSSTRVDFSDMALRMVPGRIYAVRVRVHTTDGRIGPFSGLTYFALSGTRPLPFRALELANYSDLLHPLGPNGLDSKVTHLVYETSVRYDGQGRVTGVQPASFVGYISVGNGTNVLPMNVPAGNWHEYGYNASAGQKTLTYGGRSVVSNTEFEDSGLTRKVTLPLMNEGFAARGEDFAIDRTYDRLGRPTSLRVSLNLNAAGLYEAGNIRYNDWGFVESYSRDDFGSHPVLSYGYTPTGQLRTFSFGGITETYEHDGQGNLTGHSGGLSGGNNRGLLDPTISRQPTRTYDAGNRDRSVHVQWDADGRITMDSHGGRIRSYVYSPLGHVSESAISDWRQAQFRYDAEGRRVREVYEDRVVYSLYLPDGRLALKDTFFQGLPYEAYPTVPVSKDKTDAIGKAPTPTSDPKGTIQDPVGRMFVRPTVQVVRHDLVYFQGAPLLTVAGWGARPRRLVYEFRDALGSPALTLSPHPTLGLRSAYNLYAPYGNEMQGRRDDFTLLEFAGHQGEEHLGDSSSSYMLARHYDATLGRFRQPDPDFDFDELNPSTFNLYQYARGNPVAYLDPTGRSPIAWVVRHVAGSSRYIKVRPLKSTRTAAGALRRGEEVVSKSRSTAEEIAVRAGRGRRAIEDAPHPLRDPVTHQPTGETGLPHWHMWNREGGHSAWDKNLAFGGTALVNGAADALIESLGQPESPDAFPFRILPPGSGQSPLDKVMDWADGVNMALDGLALPLLFQAQRRQEVYGQPN